MALHNSSGHSGATRLCALLCLAWTLAAAASARADPVVTLSNGEWPPYMSEHARQQGAVSQIVREAFALEGVKVKYVFRPWKRAMVEAERGEVDGSVVWSTGSAGSARERLFYFSDVVIESSTVFFHLKSTRFDWNNYADLAQVSIGGTAGYEYLFEGANIKIERAASDDINFRKLLAGRFTIFPSDLYGGQALLKEHFTPDEIARITHHPKPYDVTRYHLLMARKLKANAHYIELFNRGLKRLRESGKYGEIIGAMQRGEY
ncbi:MAG: transporter substrate-binding domain-containing protein [Pseudomonadota bacterium]